MKSSSLKLLVLVISCLLLLPSFAQERPALSEAIKSALDSKSIEDVKKQFQDVESLREKYTLDQQGILAAAAYYGQAGEIEKARALIDISMPFFQYAGDPSTLPAELSTPPTPPKTTTSAAAKSVVEKKSSPTARTDLDRFTGIYAKTGSTDRRYIMVLPSCDGKYLLFNPNWGDATGFYLESVGELTFTTSDSHSQLTINFEVNADGSGKRITHDFTYIDNPLDFQRPIPEDEAPCRSVVR